MTFDRAGKGNVRKAIAAAHHRRWCGDTSACDRTCEGKLDAETLRVVTDAAWTAAKSALGPESRADG